MSIVKLFVYKIVKCEIINVEFLSRDLLLNNIAIMVKWKCLKLLYSSKGMCRNDTQSKRLIRLKYLIIETPYTFLSIFGWYFKVLDRLNFLSSMFSGINNNNFLFFGLFNLSFFVFVFYNLKKKLFLNIFSIDLILFQVKTLISEEVFWDYQINLGNNTNLRYFWEGRTLYEGDLTFYGEAGLITT